MLRKLMVTIDGSEQSLKGAVSALELAEKTGSEVIFFEVVPPIPAFGAFEKLEHDIHERNEQMIKMAQEDIAKAAKKFVESNIPFQSKVVIGDPADKICEEAEKQGVSLIIIGTHGRTGLSRFLMGSVSSKVVAHAHCSVMVTR